MPMGQWFVKHFIYTQSKADFPKLHGSLACFSCMGFPLQNVQRKNKGRGFFPEIIMMATVFTDKWNKGGGLINHSRIDLGKNYNF